MSARISKLRDGIDDELARWLGRQHVFFVATAPLAGDGHINCSPKGGDCFRVLGPSEVAYVDYTGSGAETVAHVRENGRIVIMFCAFTGKPEIVRLYGRGEAILPGDSRFDTLAPHFPGNPGARAIVRVEVSRVSTSCGYSVPRMDFRENRDTLDRWAQSKGPNGLIEYRAQKNTASIDGLPAIPPVD
jgi:hypothetical protein